MSLKYVGTVGYKKSIQFDLAYTYKEGDVCCSVSRVKCKQQQQQQLSADVKELSPLPPLTLRFNELGQVRSVVLGRQSGRWVCIKTHEKASTEPF